MRFRPDTKVSLSLTVLVALILNSPKVLSLQRGTVLSQWVHFNLSEFFLQCTLSWALILVCYFFFLNIPLFRFDTSKRIKYLSLFLLFFAGLTYLALKIHASLYEIEMPLNFFRMAYFIKSGLIFLLLGLTVYIWEKNEETRQKSQENERLQNLYLQSQLQALRQQLNPHFLFNALSSLSSVVRENPPLAQKYIGHLSKVFRYGLKDSESLVSLETELRELESYFELIKMRFETGVTWKISLPEAAKCKLLPHLSIQPLVENAIKHNQIHPSNPLQIQLYQEDDYLVVQNDLIPLNLPEPSTQIGLSNLEERFKILTGQSLVILKSDSLFTVKLPLST